MQILTDPYKPFCAFAHYVDGVMIYAGSGTLSDAMRAPNLPLYKSMVGDKPVTIDINGEMYPTREIAKGNAAQKIYDHKPPCNIGTAAPYKGTRTGIICLETGAQYPSTREAARQTGISQGAISNVLNGRYSSVRGLTFKRV